MFPSTQKLVIQKSLLQVENKIIMQEKTTKKLFSDSPQNNFFSEECSGSCVFCHTKRPQMGHMANTHNSP